LKVTNSVVPVVGGEIISSSLPYKKLATPEKEFTIGFMCQKRKLIFQFGYLH